MSTYSIQSQIIFALQAVREELFVTTNNSEFKEMGRGANKEINLAIMGVEKAGEQFLRQESAGLFAHLEFWSSPAGYLASFNQGRASPQIFSTALYVLRANYLRGFCYKIKEELSRNGYSDEALIISE